ncbi:hypothetical protein [Chitinophaga sp.]|uniref:hypothetical protein n=1 Tax=Chitinophaga sp. TaxID=1869181 RepID=UPI002F95A29E
MMTFSKSLVASLLFASISMIACKSKSGETVATAVSGSNALFVNFGGGNVPVPHTKKLQITADASYEITYTGGKSDTIKLPGNVHDSLKPYLSSFPHSTIKADTLVSSYSLLGAADNSFETFTYIQATPADTSNISIDTGTSVPYMDDFQKRINQTIAHCKLLGN